jgi:hypothetical protein
MAGDTSGVLQLATNGSTTAITIDTSQRAAFVAGTAAAPAITTTGDTNTGMFFPAADTIAFAEGGVEAMRIDSAGNVGIGTTSVSDFGSTYRGLEVKGTDIGFIQASSAATSTTVEIMGAGTIGYVGTRTNHPLALRTFDTERMRIDTSGRVLINASSSFGGRLQSTGIAASSAACSFKVGQNGDGCVEWFNASGTYIGAVQVNASTVVYGGTSDYRLKDNIVPMTNALDKVAKLNPVTYTWKSTGEAGEGFIAHELQEIIPSAVMGEKDAVNEDGSIKPQGIDTSFLVATLTAAIQEQQTIINDLKARIETLEAK